MNTRPRSMYDSDRDVNRTSRTNSNSASNHTTVIVALVPPRSCSSRCWPGARPGPRGMGAGEGRGKGAPNRSGSLLRDRSRRRCLQKVLGHVFLTPHWRSGEPLPWWLSQLGRRPPAASSARRSAARGTSRRRSPDGRGNVSDGVPSAVLQFDNCVAIKARTTI